MTPAAQDTRLHEHLDWLRLRGLTRTYLRERRRAVERLAERLQHPPLSATETEITDWLRAMPRTTPRSRYAEHSHLSCFYRWAVTHGHLTADPMRNIPRPRLTRLLPRPMDEQSVALALSTAEPRVRLMLILAAYAGLRACEIAALHGCDLLDTGASPMLIAHGKGGKDRVVPIGETVRRELRLYGAPRRGPVFPRLDGQHGATSAQRVSATCNQHLHAVGIADSLHSLRHRFGTATYAATQDILVVGALLGHENPATTAGYAAYSSAVAIAAVRALDAPLVSAV